METYLTGSELTDLKSLLDALNRESDSGLTADVTVRDGNGEHVGFIVWNANDGAYVFITDRSVLD